MRLLNKAARSNPSGDVTLWCAEKSDKARQFYENNNFQLDGRILVWKPLPGVRVNHVGYRRHAERRAQTSMTSRSALARETQTSISSSPTAVRPR